MAGRAMAAADLPARLPDPHSRWDSCDEARLGELQPVHSACQDAGAGPW